jgi:hypothetical protein
MRLNIFFIVFTAMVAENNSLAFEQKRTSSGLPVHWADHTVVIFANSEWPTDHREADFPGGVLGAYEVWNGQTCSDFAYAPAGDIQVGANSRDHQNMVLYVDSHWPGADGVLAFTITAYSSRTGEIMDADTLVNGVEFSYSRAGTTPTAEEYDLSSVLTHEAGHMLGLEHVPDIIPVMHAGIGSGEEKRELTPDDVHGVCAIYPNGTTPKSDEGCSCETTADSGESKDEPEGVRALIEILLALCLRWISPKK